MALTDVRRFIWFTEISSVLVSKWLATASHANVRQIFKHDTGSIVIDMTKRSQSNLPGADMTPESSNPSQPVASSRKPRAARAASGDRPSEKHKAGREEASGGPVFGIEQLRALGGRLRQIRETKRWSLKRLAAESGVSVAAIQKIEMGMTNTSLLTVLALSEALGEPMDRLVRTSQIETRTRRFVHAAIPRRPTRDLDLTGSLADARLKGRVVVVPANTRLSLSPEPTQGPMFAYVLSGKLEVTFLDGTAEQLASGDAVHLGIPEHMSWLNLHKTDALVLCVNDPRQQPDSAFGEIE
jgi:transcriptional regulator with XRE-family HTH domain